MGEYRYALSKLAKGELAVGYFNESIRKDNPLYVPTNPAGTPLEVGEHRFAIGGFHRQVLPGIGRFYLDMLAVSDDAFFREINAFSYSGDQAGNLRSRRSTTSRMGVLSTWAQGYLQGQVKYTQDLINPQELVAQELPRIEGEHSVPLFGDRIVARLAGNLTDYQRPQGYDGIRLHVAPDVFVPLPFGPYLSGSVRGRIRETGYWLTDNAQTVLRVPTGQTIGSFEPADSNHPRLRREFQPLDSSRSQFSTEVGARLGTELSRVYAIGSSGKLRHTIEPELQFLWVPDIARPIGQRRLRVCTGKPGDVQGENCDATLFSEGYLFDRDDAINERNFASWGVTTRLWWRGTAAPEPTVDTPDAPPSVTSQNAREVFRATLTHGYDFSRRLVGRSHASDVDIGVQMSPLSWLSFRYDATVSLQQHDVRGQTVALSVREPQYLPPGSQGLQLPMQLALRYAFIENEVNKRADPDPPDLDVQKLLARAGSHAASANVYFRLGDYAGLFGSSSYDFNNPADGTGTGGKRIVRAPHFVDWSAYLRLISRCDCWSIDFGVYERTIEQPLDDRQFRVQFNLIGLGSFGRGAGPVGAAPNRNGILGGGLY